MGEKVKHVLFILESLPPSVRASLDDRLRKEAVAIAELLES